MAQIPATFSFTIVPLLFFFVWEFCMETLPAESFEIRCVARTSLASTISAKLSGYVALAETSQAEA